VERTKGSGRPKSARIAENIASVQELICSQEGRPGSSKSSRQAAGQLGISKSSVLNIAKMDLGLSSFKRTPVQVITEATRLKRLERCQTLLQRITTQKAKRVFFTDEKIFYINPPVNTQNNRVWSVGRKRAVDPQRLLIQRAKFSAHVMVSAGVSFAGKGRLHFVAEKTKIDANYYVNSLLPNLVDDCENLLPDVFIFQQDGAPAHTARLTQDWLDVNCPDFITKDEWPPNSPDLNPLDYHVWGAMLQKYQQHNPKPTTTDELKAVLQVIWDELPQQSVENAILTFRKRLQQCIEAEGRHIEHLL
jgi:inhibitor of nuclear factor kappa-B kinase subunit alpha